MKEEDRLIKRLEVSERALEMLERADLPNLKRLLCGARCEVRKITDPKMFWATPDSDEKLQSEFEASQSVGIVRSTSESLSRFCVFANRNLDEAESSLMAKMLRSFMAVTYAAVGLDMVQIVDTTTDSHN